MRPVSPSIPDDLLHAWHRDLGGDNGFMPRLAPADRLPARWSPLLEAALTLPERYHRPGADVRPWLAALFAAPVPDAEAAVRALSEPEADRLETATGVLCHAFRWASAPPLPERYLETGLTLPQGLADVWGAMGRVRGHPRVGNMYAMVLANWSLEGVPGGAPYRVGDFNPGAYRIALPWLGGDKLAPLTAFLGTSIETEARGACAVRTAVELVGAAAADDALLVCGLLGRLRGELERMSEPFMFNIRKSNFSSDDFLTLIQPTTIWGLDEGDGVLEGASGPQIGCLQVADAVLGVDRSSPMGQAVLHSRQYLPERHRRFLEVFDRHAPTLPAYVLWKQDDTMTGLLNACLEVMMGWRRMHQKRGAMNLKSQQPDRDLSYASSGGVIALEAERVARFEEAMGERMAETRAARIEAPAAVAGQGEAAPAGLEHSERQRA